MSDHSRIEDKIKSSDAYKSLRAEKDIATCLESYGWTTRHSPYYTDEKTGKSRELDIAASGYWRKSLKHGSLVVRINLFVEVKSNSDFHILCAGNAEEQTHFGGNEYWLGYSEETLNRIEALLTRYRFEHPAIRQFMHDVEKIAFPRHTMRVSSLRISPPPATDYFSAFRETNGKTEKDLDSSVLWRAALSLRSAIRSAQVELITAVETDLETDIEAARRAKSPLKDYMLTIDNRSTFLSLYIPIVVIQSRLWSAVAEEPKELKWFRLVQYGTFGDAQDWIDVVNQDHLADYLRDQSIYFEKTFKKARAERYL